ncbi:hypothetical protein UA08_08241 [Talaromyces atroroseus]|uniref:Beta-lactamase-related domain-containing protein n=1 Tax=Talaromyces atroroseus TaxID=1441469 RepID=A0A225ACB1_TALAT|nr:hypothetical protein UA08_08241 [Talaromyces atroroseus]OKL56493.1 hypothetical protein UA08_08241 [Talaromyces atroroseus]
MAASQSPADIQASLRQLLDKTTAGPTPSVAGLVYQAVGRHGEPIFSHASGARGLVPGSSSMTPDTVFWMASCTKMITGIACMQLVEQGKLALDDVHLVERLAPELRDVKVLDGDARTGFRLVEKQRGITLRMLLSHTAGFGYPFDDPRLRDYSFPIGFDEFAGNADDVLGLPLVNQPGTKFQYGVNVDWAGALVERVTGLSLDEYFRAHIFEPLGIEDIRFFPTADMKKRLAYMHRRDGRDGSLKVVDHQYRFPLAEKRSSLFCSGGAGCFGTVAEYCTDGDEEIITVLLNNGTCPRTNARILSPESINGILLSTFCQASINVGIEMFTDQIPQLPRYPNRPAETAKPHLAKPSPVRPLANPAADAQRTEGWGLTFALSHVDNRVTGRPAGTGSWEGIANLFWFADRKSGIGAMIASQILPYGDNAVLDVNEAVEQLLYSGLKRTEDSYK